MKKKIVDICRLILGVVFFVSGFVKAVDPLGTVYKVEDYLKAFGGFMVDLLPLAPVAAYALIFTEVLLAILLLCGLCNRFASWATLAFYAVMTPLTLWIALTDPVSDCGCFGDAIVLSNWQTFWKNVVLIILAITSLYRDYTERFRPFKWVAAVVILLPVLFVMICSWVALPIIDFRPYKIGANIPELMEIPDDAPQPVYETKLIYADADGNEHEFDLTNYPKGDSTWTFVDQKSKLVKKGYEAPIHDFEILNADFEDITYDILETEDKVTLCIMYDLAKADRSKMDRIAELAEESDIFFVVTGSGADDIEEFGFPEGVEVCTCDPVTLKTIVRANPGIVEIKNGTIINKFKL